MSSRMTQDSSISVAFPISRSNFSPVPSISSVLQHSDEERDIKARCCLLGTLPWGKQEKEKCNGWNWWEEGMRWDWKSRKYPGVLLCHTTLRGTEHAGANKASDWTGSHQTSKQFRCGWGFTNVLCCLERSQLARSQSAQAKEMVSGKQPVDREEAGSPLLQSLMPPKAHFLEGDTIGCALLNKIPQSSKTVAAIPEGSSVSYLWECLWFLQAASCTSTSSFILGYTKER